MSPIGNVLAAAHAGTLRLEALIITDWRDGPIGGIARLSAGDRFWKFKIFAEIPGADDLDGRLFLLAQLSPGASETRIAEVVAGQSLPLVWPFNDRPDSADVRSAVDIALESAEPETLVMSSVDFDTVLKA